jgi:FkbM family methyltransferase
MQYDRRAAILDPQPHTQERFLAEIFDPNEALIIFDIGACEGENSVRYSRIFPNSSIHTFEPVDKNYQRILKNIEEFKATQVKAYPICLSNEKGTAVFHLSSGVPDEFKDKEVDWEFGNKSSSLLPPDKTLEAFEWLEFKEKITVPTERLENIIQQESIDHIDFIHMDVQGAELMVLDGSGEHLNKIRNIWLEVETVPLYKDQPIKSDVEKYLSERGFTRLLDTLDSVAGDQFWSNTEWIIQKKGKAWVDAKVSALKALEKSKKPGLVSSVRNKIQLRTRLRKLFN